MYQHEIDQLMAEAHAETLARQLATLASIALAMAKREANKVTGS